MYSNIVFYRKGSDRMKFFCYSLFGWGMPLGMAVLTGLFDHFSIGNVRPQMGESFCFLSIRGAWFFFYMPILILLCFNTLMYVVTIYSLWKTKKTTKKATLSRIQSERCSRNYTLVNKFFYFSWWCHVQFMMFFLSETLKVNCFLGHTVHDALPFITTGCRNKF